VFPPVPSEILIEKRRMRIKILSPFWKSVLMSTKGGRDSQKRKGASWNLLSEEVAEVHGRSQEVG
jgi:hypothetical protein